MASPARLRAVLLALAALLAALLVSPIQAANAAEDKKIVTGGINCPKSAACPALKLLWFDKNWHYLGEKKLGKGAKGYSINLVPGTYHLQLVDLRPAYDISKYAPTDAKVTVQPDRAYAERNFTMRKGAAVTGTAVNGKGGKLGGATVVAAMACSSDSCPSYPTQANKKGQFAVGGLPEGKYSLFTYDKAKTWVDKSTWAGAVRAGQAKNVKVRLSKKAGDLVVYLTTPGADLLRKKTTLTVSSKATGQWWSATSGTGTFTFRGVHPGAYRAQFNGAGVWLPATGGVQGSDVRSNQFDRGEFRLTKRGGWLRGVVVDSANPDIALADAVVELYDAAGTKLDSTTSAADGSFKLDGQLTTQGDLTVVVQPGPYTDYLGTDDQRCQYTRTEHGGYAVTTGEESWIGGASIDRKPGGTCRAPTRARHAGVS